MIHGEFVLSAGAMESHVFERLVAGLPLGPAQNLLQAYALHAHRATGSYRAAAALLDVDQRTLRKWVVEAT